MKVAILGLGLVGGSLARTLARRCPDWSLRGHSLDDGVALARQAGLALQATDSLQEAVRGADLAVVAVPPSSTPEVVAACLDADPGLAVTDTAGVKGPLRERLRGHAGRARWVPGHPIAGREGAGFAASEEGIFAGAAWILTPDGETDAGETPYGETDASETAAAALALVRRLLEGLGAVRIEMSAEHHDRLLAHTSHLPHLLVWALLRAATEAGLDSGDILRGTGGGLRDLVRIATSPAPIWSDISVANAPALRPALGRLIGQLQELDAALDAADRSALQDWIEAGAETARRIRPGTGT